ncbi:MAG: multifunctional CCA tRNA nucleotidyl transferase/2'3'-cyclic phosphodiesterase/2'nucleotidase/phosphatase [Alphaproteobacteria bacterium]|nr:multifunctional CCA tRNA nucleotidyl transferase/2'3'-cyclic phosphodiesterase/2'nucleotidase/phosphatase [Alphaproteobacteria bacterium]
MKIYQVGESVRDELLGQATNDIGYVVIGSSVSEMKQNGFRRVGKFFPVFLHPENHNEYTLARKKIATGNGKTEYIFDTTVTLEDDLKCRDFTVNALAKDPETGVIIDPFNGQEDLRQKIIRHVDEKGFSDDPVRAVRMCRLAAQLGFQIAPETTALTNSLLEKGAFKKIPGERIWGEFRKALNTQHFDSFLEMMHMSGVLKAVLPDVDKLWDMPEKEKYHPEGNSGAHTLLTIRASDQKDPLVTFALMLHDIGKTRTKKEILPSHHGHEINGIPVIKRICYRLKAPAKFRDFALLCCQNHMNFFRIQEMRIGTLYDFLKKVTNNFQDLATFERFAEVCRCDNYGRAVELTPEEKEKHNKSLQICRDTIQKTRGVNITAMPNFKNLFTDKGMEGKIREYIIQRIQ